VEHWNGSGARREQAGRNAKTLEHEPVKVSQKDVLLWATRKKESDRVFDDMSPATFALYKLCKEAIYPFTWSWILLVVTVILLFCRQTPARLKAARMTAGSALVLLYSLSTGLVSSYLAGVLEQEYPPYSPVTGRSYDAIVVLSGDLNPAFGARPVTELSYSSLQRTLCGSEAFLQGLSSRLVMAGGTAVLGQPIDAREMANLAVRLNVPEQALVLEEVSRNTYESAKEVKRILGQGAKILLVSSAMHMPRAVRLYLHQGMNVTPYPCGYRTWLKVGTWQILKPSMFKPDLGSLDRSTSAINEFVGLAVYRVAGRL
jgi:uncharacterized SAM-binding protein YcdF (DUF218 family)